MSLYHQRSECTILVVDDERELRFLAEAFLDELGYGVLLADCGRAAIRLLRENSAAVQAVLLDMTMPGMEPEEILRGLREISPALPIIILSGHSEASVHNRFAAGTISGYIQKPYTEVDLDAALTKAFAPPLQQPRTSFQLQPLSALDRQELAQEFLAARKADLTKMREALAASDFGQLAILSHTLKGGGGCFGFPELTIVGAALERYSLARDAISCTRQLALLKNYLGEPV